MSLESNSPSASASSDTAPSVQADPRQLFKSTGAESPLDFIKKNSEAILRKPEVAKVEAPKAEVSLPTVEVKTEPSKVEVKSEFNPLSEEEQKVTSPVVEDDLEENKNPLEVNIKKIRDNLKSERQARKAKEEEALRFQTELEEYKTGKKLPDTLQNQENEIARLKIYEKVHGLKTSPEYHEKYVSPINQVRGEQDMLLEEYEIPKEVFNQIRGLKLKEQNQFLSENFDTTAQIKMRSLLDNEGKLYREMEEANKEPELALNRLLQEAETAKAMRVKNQREGIQHSFRESWGRTLTGIKEQGQFEELIHRPNDTDYNSRVVNPIIQGAATEAGKLMTMLVEDGLTKIRPEVGEFISKMTLLAHSSALNAHTREVALKHARELEKNQNRVNNILRPSIGGSSVNVGTGSQERVPYTAESMAKAATSLLRK